MKRTIIVACSIALLLVGCMNKDATWQPEPKDDLELTKLSVRGVTDQQPADQAKEFLSHYEEVAGVRAVNHDGILVVAVDLNHHDRFFLENVEKGLHRDIRENFSDMEITLSTDYKIFIELKRLEEDILNNNVKKDEIKKRLDEIIKLSKEQT